MISFKFSGRNPDFCFHLHGLPGIEIIARKEATVRKHTLYVPHAGSRSRSLGGGDWGGEKQAAAWEHGSELLS